MMWYRVEGCTTTLNSIAQTHYGDWRLWRYIYDHNEDALAGQPLYAPLPAGLCLVLPVHPRLVAMVEPAGQLDETVVL